MTGLGVVKTVDWVRGNRGFHARKSETRAFLPVAFGDPPNTFPYFNA